MEYFYYRIELDSGETLYSRTNAPIKAEGILKILGLEGKIFEITYEEYELADVSDN